MKRTPFPRCLAVVLILAVTIQWNVQAASSEQDRTAWWREASFGMFIHWGVYATPGRGEWILYQEHIPVEEYIRLADQFRPEAYEPREWVALAKEAGMKYMVLTTRHHDGYCLFDSKVSDFTSVKTAARRDFVRDFADACHEAGMPIGFYYSLVDWRFPDILPVGVHHDPAVYAPMVEQAHAQVRELLTQYGKIDILWYDMLSPHDPELWRAKELNAMARELQPHILINDRAGLPEDFGTPENRVTPENRPWEACYTMNRSWAYCPTDRNYKPVHELIRLLASCASSGGNLLLNVSPDPQGRIPVEQVDRLREIGRWIRGNGKAIYGAVQSPVDVPVSGHGFPCGRQGLSAHATLARGNVALRLVRKPGDRRTGLGHGPRSACRATRRPRVAPWLARLPARSVLECHRSRVRWGATSFGTTLSLTVFFSEARAGRGDRANPRGGRERR